jgi:hypothetical protein
VRFGSSAGGGAEGRVLPIGDGGPAGRADPRIRRRSVGGGRQAPGHTSGGGGPRGGIPVGGWGEDPAEERVVAGRDREGNQAGGRDGAAARSVGGNVNGRSETVALLMGERAGGLDEAEFDRIGGSPAGGWRIGLAEVRGKGRRAASGRCRSDGHPDLAGPIPGPGGGRRRGATGGAEEEAEGQERDLARRHTVLCRSATGRRRVGA